MVARHASWSVTRFAPPAARARERRLGLGAVPGFVAAPSRRTVLRRPSLGPLAELRASGRGLVLAPVSRATGGLPRPRATMLWTRSIRSGRPRRSSAAPAWRA